jgi:hypothetical protein
VLRLLTVTNIRDGRISSLSSYKGIEFEGLTAVIVKSSVLWDITPWSPAFNGLRGDVSRKMESNWKFADSEKCPCLLLIWNFESKICHDNCENRHSFLDTARFAALPPLVRTRCTRTLFTWIVRSSPMWSPQITGVNSIESSVRDFAKDAFSVHLCQAALNPEDTSYTRRTKHWTQAGEHMLNRIWTWLVCLWDICPISEWSTHGRVAEILSVLCYLICLRFIFLPILKPEL